MENSRQIKKMNRCKKVQEKYRDGCDVEELATEYKVSKATIYLWIRVADGKEDPTASAKRTAFYRTKYAEAKKLQA